MIIQNSSAHQPNQFGTDLLMQLDFNNPLLKLSSAIPWHDFDQSFSVHYSVTTGAPSKLIRLVVGLSVLKQLENLSDEAVVLQWKRNPCYQAFCGMTEFQCRLPCHSTELVHLHKRKKRGKIYLLTVCVQHNHLKSLNKSHYPQTFS